uniref:ribonuclease H n=1 Tax=Pelusios castaneus TaxID=367368 RepID=A0A8C8SJ05_9SAUR
MGMDLMEGLEVIIDLPNRVIMAQEAGEKPLTVAASYRVGAIKTLEVITPPQWEPCVEAVVGQFPNVFAKNKLQCGKVDGVVRILGPDPKPQKQYRYPKVAEECLRQSISVLMEQGVLSEVCSPCNSPIWPVRKADGKTWRLTVDYRELNKVAPRMAPVVAKFQEIITAINAGAKWFSVLDLANAFFSIQVDKRDAYKLAFTFLDRQLTFSRLPQGFHNAPSICHKRVTQMWREMPQGHRIISYVDDILIATDTKKENLLLLAEVLKKIEDTGFLVNAQKAQIVKRKVTYLGVDLGVEGRSPNLQRVELISKLPVPGDVTALRSFLGLTGFSRDFVEGYAIIARPLYLLLRKNVEWMWGAEQQEAFVKLKKALLEAPALAFPKEGVPFRLQVLHTTEGISAVLSQDSGSGERAIAYGSRILSAVEQEFSLCEKEALALVWAISHWEYIIGLSPIILKSAHSPIKYILSGRVNEGKVSNPRIANWTLVLANREIAVNSKTPQSLAPYALLCTGAEHECPLPSEGPKMPQTPFQVLDLLKVQTLEDLEVWATDGSCYYVDGKPVAGYGAVRLADGKVLQGTVKPQSAQAAEIVAIAAVLEEANTEQSILIIMDSEWSLRALLEWMPVWLGRGMLTGDGKPVVYAKFLLHVWSLAKSRTGKTFLGKVKAHRKVNTKWSELNSRADQLAKEAARLGPEYLWEKSDSVSFPLGELQDQPAGLQTQDLKELQTADKEIQDLVRKGSWQS